MRTTADIDYPGESYTVDGISKHVSQERGPGGQGWEVSMHVWALPVHHLEEAKNQSVAHSKYAFFFVVVVCFLMSAIYLCYLL